MYELSKLFIVENSVPSLSIWHQPFARNIATSSIKAPADPCLKPDDRYIGNRKVLIVNSICLLSS